MKFVEVSQGTAEWLALRAGVCTASCFSDAVAVLSKKSGDKLPGDPSAASDRYASDLAIERISGKPYGEPVKAWVLARGHELEPFARQGWEMATSLVALEAGIVLTDDGGFGYSTDGMVNPYTVNGVLTGCEGLIEIKCPIDTQKILAIRETGDLSEYMHQMQGGMWITGAKWCDFIMYVPDLEPVGNELYIKRVERDEELIETTAAGLLKFNQRVEVFKDLLSKQAA
ncbi:lambda exonuclease family protein [Polaromonas sp.]|uniref:lambda exonuclease family protein n=1 Tax=Polaromonas sp. TaxID=1869339 RepID=UPI003751F8B3